MTLLEQAIIFATERHSGAIRKSEKTPYILHPFEAASIVSTMTSDEEVLTAAVLHDTVEDTSTSILEIEERFGVRVAKLVASETENKRKKQKASSPWRLRKEESLKELRDTDDINVKMLWLGDKLSNMRAFYRSWKRNGNALWENFNQKDPAQQAWYYRTIAELLSELKDYEAWQEFSWLVSLVFKDVD